MRAHLAMLTAVALAFVLTIFGPLVFSSAYEQPAAAAPAKPDAAGPGLVWRSGGLAMQLTDRPCPFEEMAAELEAEGLPPARAYTVTQNGQRSTGCWIRDVGGDVLTRTPGGQEGTIPLAWFQREPTS